MKDKVKNTKKQFRYFSIFDYEKEQDYLRQMHNEGWKFVKVTGVGTYHFEKCQPQDVVYQLDYNQEGREHKSEYVQMFADCGWEYLIDFAGYSYFRKPAAEMNGDEQIFCDDESRMEMMDRVYKGRFTPLMVILFTVLLPQFIFSLTIYDNYVLAAFFGSCMIGYLIVFAIFAAKRNDYRNSRK